MPSSRPALARFPRAAVLALAATVLIPACGGGGGGQAPRGAAPPATVTAQAVAESAWTDSIEALGTAQANESVTITAKVTEVVRSVRFRDGDVVRRGDVLVELTGAAEVANLRETQAALNEAQQQLERLEPLVAQGTLPRAQLDTQRAARDSARARADAIRARLAERVITAPFDGVLGFRQVSDGALVSPGTVITTLDDLSVIKLDFSVPESLMANLAGGQEIAATSIAFPEREFSGVVTSVGSRVDPVSRAVTVRAELPNPDGLLKPGMLMTVALMSAPRRALVIPELSLIQVGNRQSVFVVRGDGTVEEVPVRSGARRRGEVEVVQGLNAGEVIVVEGVGKLRSGQAVTVVDRPATASGPRDADAPAEAPPQAVADDPADAPADDPES
ncbi:MAG: efflux RND transporter periplasmic adaptor subunit [Xanthomonadales bacterium]|nr:efflux RND transporter periplasmic adaptor subunit [Xanthomonadales bacterium]